MPYFGLFVPPHLPAPVRADALFPEVFRAEHFAYEDPTSPETKLRALKDAVEAARLHNSSNFMLPPYFSAGMEKISKIVGQEVNPFNARGLRKTIEKESPCRAEGPGQRWFERILRARPKNLNL